MDTDKTQHLGNLLEEYMKEFPECKQWKVIDLDEYINGFNRREAQRQNAILLAEQAVEGYNPEESAK